MKDATMQDNQSVAHEADVAGQKYAFATASLVLALLCFVNVAGLEKAVVAILFGLQALRREPPPALVHRRTWAKAGVALGMIFLTVIPVLGLLVTNAYVHGAEQTSSHWVAEAATVDVAPGKSPMDCWSGLQTSNARLWC